jgi:hypothetical protein
MGKEIADEVRRFILTCIDSVPQIEALIVFHSGPEAQY